MSRVIMHLDMDAFFAAVEQRDNPSLRGKPVIIGALPGERGVVSTASYEARKFGVHSAMPISQAVKLCPDGIYLRPSGRRYSDASEAVESILEEISPVVEMASIDEAYMDITGCQKLLGTPREIAMLAKDKIRRSLHLTATAGIGPNRLIAKIASDMKKPDGLTIVEPEEVMDFLAPLPVSKIPGIGKKSDEALKKMRIVTIGQLAKRSEEDLVFRFGDAMGHFLHERSHGISSDAVGGEEGRKSISKERTFGEDTTDEDLLNRVLLNLACDVGRTARREGLLGRSVTLKIRLSGFETHTCSRTFDESFDEDKAIFRKAWELYQTSPYVGRPVRLIGLGISDLADKRGAQMNLFTGEKEARSRKVYEAIDQISQRFGKRSIRPAHAFDPYDKKKRN